MRMENPILISIEANIGAGKSTIIQKLQEVLCPTYYTCIQEPIDYWKNFSDPDSNHSLLELYYKEPNKYAFALQTMIYSSLSNILNQTIENVKTNRHFIITERSQQSSSGIFADMLYKSDIMSNIEYQIYKNCIANNPKTLDLCIYLRTEPEVCYERVRYRNRIGEQKITLDYLKNCHKSHEQWISELPPNTHLRIIEVGTKSPEKILTEVLKILEDISYI